MQTATYTKCESPYTVFSKAREFFRQTSAVRRVGEIAQQRPLFRTRQSRQHGDRQIRRAREMGLAAADTIAGVFNLKRRVVR